MISVHPRPESLARENNMALRPSFWLLFVPGQIAQNQQDLHSAVQFQFQSTRMFPTDLTDTDDTYFII